MENNCLPYISTAVYVVITPPLLSEWRHQREYNFSLRHFIRANTGELSGWHDTRSRIRIAVGGDRHTATFDAQSRNDKFIISHIFCQFHPAKVGCSEGDMMTQWPWSTLIPMSTCGCALPLLCHLRGPYFLLLYTFLLFNDSLNILPRRRGRKRAFHSKHNVPRTWVVLSEWAKLFCTVRKERRRPLFINFLLERTAFVEEPSCMAVHCTGNCVNSTSYVRLPCSWRITIIIRIRKRVPLQDNIKVCGRKDGCEEVGNLWGDFYLPAEDIHWSSRRKMIIYSIYLAE